jgi:hypothetical protein
MGAAGEGIVSATEALVGTAEPRGAVEAVACTTAAIGEAWGVWASDAEGCAIEDAPKEDSGVSFCARAAVFGVIGARADEETVVAAVAAEGGGRAGKGRVLTESLTGGGKSGEVELLFSCHHATEPKRTTPPTAAAIGRKGERCAGFSSDGSSVGTSSENSYSDGTSVTVSVDSSWAASPSGNDPSS